MPTKLKENTSSPTITKKTFLDVNDKKVDGTSLEFFYRPHAIILLLGCIVFLTFIAFSRDPKADFRGNVITGCVIVFIFCMVISILGFPNGPFTQPHPIIWRMGFGSSVLYLLILQFLVHQDYETVHSLIVLIDPSLQNYTIDMEGEYGQKCWDITFERIWSHFDWFAFGHYWGWALRALSLRHYGICWSISIVWELTEMAFGHLLPNFYECWWDYMILDVLLCNGLGIFTGMQVCKWLEMREHHWESIKSIKSKKGTIKQALLQFTPESFNSTCWPDPECSWTRFVAVFPVVLCYQFGELNTFFIKHFFPMPAEHPICISRILLVGFVAVPATRQYYTYVTDKTCKRIGTQIWVVSLILFSEIVFIVKFGLELFSQTQISKMVLWLLVNFVVSILGMIISMKIHKWRYGSTSLTERAKTHKTK